MTRNSFLDACDKKYKRVETWYGGEQKAATRQKTINKLRRTKHKKDPKKKSLGHNKIKCLETTSRDSLVWDCYWPHVRNLMGNAASNHSPKSSLLFMTRKGFLISLPCGIFLFDSEINEFFFSFFFLQVNLKQQFLWINLLRKRDWWW